MRVQNAFDRNSLAISLVLPAWNEQEVIGRAVAEADAAMRDVGADYEIIVVDDGSHDTTAQIVASIAAQNCAVRLVQHASNQGYGASLRSGFAAAAKELVVFTDADCQFDLTELPRLLSLAANHDIVCGFRIDRKDTWLRCFYSRVYNRLVRTLFHTHVRDIDCAFKLFRRDFVQQLDISKNGFLVNTEILVRARQQGKSIAEVGVSHRPRLAGDSTVSIKHVPIVMVDLFAFWYHSTVRRDQAHPSVPSPRMVTHPSISDRPVVVRERRC